MSQVTPQCCEGARSSETIVWFWSEDWDFERGQDGKYVREEGPGWAVLTSAVYSGENARRRARFCPYCGAALPPEDVTLAELQAANRKGMKL